MGFITLKSWENIFGCFFLQPTGIFVANLWGIFRWIPWSITLQPEIAGWNMNHLKMYFLHKMAGIFQLAMLVDRRVS